MLKLLCDGRWISNTGIGRFSREILSAKPHDFSIQMLKSRAAIRNPISPFILSFESYSRKPDVFWSPGFIPPLASKCPAICTMHDLTHLHYGSSAQKIYYNAVIRPIARKLTRIQTDSKYSQSEIADWLGVEKSRIDVVQLGVSEEFYPGGETFLRNRAYIIYVGNRKAHKNLHGLIRAFARAEIRNSVVLAVTGTEDELTTNLIVKLRLQKRVLFLGFLDEKGLASAYRGAIATILVSFYEGFGLPPLESMACGTPVIVSNNTSLPEVVGDAGIYCNPHDTDSIAQAITILVNNAELRVRLAKLGLARAKLFRWENCASTTWDNLRLAISMGA